EFIIVLADCSRDAAETKRRELQDQVNTIEFEVRPGKRLKLGASAGAAVFPYDGATYESLLAEADHAMYRDKASRRHQTPLQTATAPNEFVADMIADAAPAPSIR